MALFLPLCLKLPASRPLPNIDALATGLPRPAIIASEIIYYRHIAIAHYATRASAPALRADFAAAERDYGASAITRRAFISLRRH